MIEEYNKLQLLNNQFTQNQSNVWQQVGPDNVPLQSNGEKRGIGRINTIVFHPTDPNVFYVGSPCWRFLEII